MAVQGDPPPHATQDWQTLGFNLGAIALVLILMGLGLANLLDANTRTVNTLPSLTTNGPTIEKNIAGQRLAIPPAWFRYADQRVEGFTERLDIIFALPLGVDRRIIEVAVSLVPASRIRTSDLLLDAVYLHQFLPTQIEGPPGLVGKPLRGEDGFQNETVWYDPLSPTPFVAKCETPVAGASSGNCIRTVKLSEQVAATYIFDQSVLNAWRDFDIEAAAWLKKIGGI